MRVSQNLIGVPGDECICGRRRTVIHCPACGSTRKYARSNRMHTLVDGTERFVKTQLRCMSCGHEYIEAECEFCEAPPVGPKLAAQKVKALYEAKQAGERLDGRDAKMLRMAELLTGKSASKISPEQRRELENKLDMMIRSAWADMMYAFSQGNGPEPPPCEEWVAERKKEFRVNDNGDFEQIKTQDEVSR